MSRPSLLHVALGLAALVAAGGCAEDEGLGAAELLLPDAVELHWDASFNGEGDGLGAMVPLDVMVYERETGEPLGDVSLQLQADHGATSLVYDDGFRVIEPDQCVECALEWDARHDQYILLEDALDASVPNGIELQTDVDGLARVYLFVDAFPGGASTADFAPVSVLVSMGMTGESFDLVPR